nr:transposase [Kyrpidia spormannii]
MIRDSQHPDQLQSMVMAFFKEYQVGKLLRKSHITKQAGISVLEVFRLLFTLVFYQRILKSVLEHQLMDKFGKDTVYRFLNSPRHNWRRFLLLLSSAVVHRFARLTSENRTDVFIIDDSLFSRSRSKKMELLSKVYDHVSHQFVRGFRMLTLSWSDGNSFVPLCLSLLSSENKRNRLCGINESVDKRTCGYKRRQEGTRKATDVMFKLLEQAQAMGISAKYLLFDSWFSYPSTILQAVRHSLHLVCMLKNMPKVRYGYEGQHFRLSQLYQAIRKRRGRAKILGSVTVQLGEGENGAAGSGQDCVRARSKPFPQVAGASMYRHSPGRRRDRPDLWEAMGHRDIVQGHQILSPTGERTSGAHV